MDISLELEVYFVCKSWTGDATRPRRVKQINIPTQRAAGERGPQPRSVGL